LLYFQIFTSLAMKIRPTNLLLDSHYH
jgi:hypothetical protein